MRELKPDAKRKRSCFSRSFWPRPGNVCCLLRGFRGSRYDFYTSLVSILGHWPPAFSSPVPCLCKVSNPFADPPLCEHSHAFCLLLACLYAWAPLCSHVFPTCSMAATQLKSSGTVQTHPLGTSSVPTFPSPNAWGHPYSFPPLIWGKMMKGWLFSHLLFPAKVACILMQRKSAKTCKHAPIWPWPVLCY